MLTKFHKCHLGGSGMIECVRAGLIQDFEFWERGGGEEIQSSVLIWRGCIAHNN